MFIVAVFGFFSSIFITLFVRNFAKNQAVLDAPDQTRKFQEKPVPLLGGVGLFLSFWLVVGYLLYFQPILGIDLIKGKLFAAFVGSLIILAVGIADDIRGLPAVTRLVITSFAIGLSVTLGLGLPKITNPLGGVIYLSQILGQGLVFFWLLGMTYTTKITDGLDGLATGIVAIGSLMLYFLASSKLYFQPNVAMLALVFFAVCLGFLIFNFSPASIYLGESGSLFVGYILGVLAVISGGKVATALLAMAIPVFDLVRVIIIRRKEKSPIFGGDRRHLHFRLVDAGFAPPTVAIIYYLFAAVFGFAALYLKTLGKAVALLFLVVLMLLVSKFLKKNPNPVIKIS